MKHFSKLATTAALSLGSLAIALPVSAAGYNITSSYLNGLPVCAAPSEQPVAVAGGCKYDPGAGTSYYLGTGDYTLGEDLTLDGKSLVFDGASSFNLNGKTISDGGTVNYEGTVQVRSGTLALSDGTISGRTNISGGNVTISGLTNTDATTISGGTVTINSGAFSANMGTSAIYAWKDANITINGGTFTSAQDKGIEVAWDDDNFNFTGTLRINGGTFTGNTHGLIVGDPSQITNITLAGGTFKYTGTNDTFGAIGISSLDAITTSSLNGLLASGYSYSDATANVASEYAIYNAVLTNHSVTIVGGSTPDPESGSTDDSSSTTSVESTESVGTPDSGRVTSEGGSATASVLATVGAATAITSAAYLAKKHFAKKNAQDNKKVLNQQKHPHLWVFLV